MPSNRRSKPPNCHEEFVQAALRSYEETLATDVVYDGPEYLEYFRAKARGQESLASPATVIEFVLEPQGMTRLVLSARAANDLDRLAEFLAKSLPQEADKTADVVVEALGILKNHPGVGRAFGPGLRELVISRGRSGYLALYKYNESTDTAVVIAIRHQREAGYHLV